MIRLIHTADLHLDSKMESNLSPEKAKQRREELLDTFARMVDFAEEQGVSAVLIAGDLFDKTHIRKTAKARVTEIITEHPMIDFLYLQGNHDRTDFLAELSENMPRNLKIFTDETWTSYTYEEENLVITGRELTKENSRDLYTNLILDRSKVNIVMLHGQESDYSGPDRTEIINLTELKNRNIDYLALGHIHKYKNDRLDERGEYCYAGCPEGRGFDECGEKGFVLLTVHDQVVDSEFIPFALRTFHEVAAEVTPDMMMPDILEAVENAIRKVPSADLLKVVLTGTKEMDFDIDTPRIVRQFSDRFFFFKLYDKTKIRIDYERYKNDRTLKGEFVRLLQAEEGLSEEERSMIIELGMKAIMGEEIEA